MAYFQPTRNQIGLAFWNLLTQAPGFNGNSRKFVHWDGCPGPFPFLTLLKTNEERIRQTDGTPAIKFLYTVFVYTMIGDASAVPEVTTDNLLDAIDLTVQATGSDIGQNQQTLGGLVYWCQPRGKVFVDPGDTDGKGVSAIPFELLSSWFV